MSKKPRAVAAAENDAVPVETANAPGEDAKPAAVRVAAATMSALQLTTTAEAAPARAVARDDKQQVFHASLVQPVSIPSGWQIQIGAFAGEPEAQSSLQAARSRLGTALAKVHAFTEKTVKGSVEYIRARFAGFRNEADAKKACEALRRNDFACITVKD